MNRKQYQIVVHHEFLENIADSRYRCVSYFPAMLWSSTRIFKENWQTTCEFSIILMKWICDFINVRMFLQEGVGKRTLAAASKVLGVAAQAATVVTAIKG